MDENKEFKKEKDKYIYTSKVNYPNNKSLVKQNVYINKDGKITKVEVVDKEGNAEIIMNIAKEKINKKFDKKYFELSSVLKINKDNNNTKENTNQSTIEKKEETNTNTNDTEKKEEPNTNTNDTEKKEESTKNTASINDVVYPMYLPNNTYLTSQEKINTQTGERLILTFDGDSSFILVEETGKIEDDNVIIPTSGEFDFLTDVIGIIKEHSLSWNSNGIDYYITSKVIDTPELINIAKSISILPVSK